MPSGQSQVVYAPSEEAPRGTKTLYLAGGISKTDAADWRETLASSLSDVPLTVYNPVRPDWDSTWREDVDFAPYREQVHWELDKLAKADMVAVYFHPATQAPISLLEFGLFAQVPGKVVVVCPTGYWKRGNVQIVCQKFGIQMLESLDGLPGAIVERLFPTL